ncbi:nitroreductase family protein [Paenibacillus oenotherae]|uniref:Nitroreductase family protein n=1 Tax=Paenibacillus oenotherae TaxID=1435645 RepID=A0ABS7DD32_9BACL|nr:nitroreductase family protein [Paenibacillus oenotherae]MBW7477561.1 nitroreductase family protein [Paenibacillus oenotherae]
MSHSFFESVKKRRTIYGISKDSVISDEQLEKLVGEAVLHTPSAFNSQSARVVLLLKDKHDKLWDITEETLKAIVPADSFASTAEKMAAFRSGYGTVLFFEDQTVIQGLQEQYAAYKDNFPLWSQHSSGMLQFVVWTALELEGYGASLQHYNPLIDEKVGKEWDIPSSWKLIAEMPFGKPTAPAGEKTFEPLEKRLKVFK